MTAASLFITGASGFVGRHVLAQLDPQSTGRVVCLSRQAEPAAATGQGAAPAEWVRGSVEDASTYAAHLGPDTTVLHLAALTGKGRAVEHERVNAGGTRALLAASAQRGIRRVIFVSSIAARYADLRVYPYARAKRAAESMVRESGVPFVVVRPTVVLGRESPMWQRLRQMASGAVVPVIGSGRARMQPIHVRDAADALIALTQDESAAGLFELGGPEIVSISDLLVRIHRLTHTRDPRLIHVPHAPLSRMLSALEPWAYRFLPVTAGQLSVFVQDSTVEPTDRLCALWPRMRRVDQILDELRPEAD